MSDEPYPSETMTDVEGGVDDDSVWPPPDEQHRVRAPRIVWLVAALIVIGIPISVGLTTFLSPSSQAASASHGESLGELSSAAPSRSSGAEDVAGPKWVRSAWAEAVPGLTAFELPAGSDVSYANGRLRPSLGISCADGRTDVHVTTGGTAQINPETSGHVVNLTFDQSGTQAQQWVAAHDQRALFAQDGFGLAGRIATARRLRFGFTHYMSGPVVVEFDLRGADDVIASMAAPCGWGD